MTTNQLRMLLALAPILVLAACAEQRGSDFVLPEGDTEAGQALFVNFGCNSCHTISNMDLPLPEEEGPVRVLIGGRVSRVKTYPELVTSIINPSHAVSARYLRVDEVSRDGESLMIAYNDVMTVAELVNLVAFLESSYEELERPPRRYAPYSMREAESE